VGSTEETLKKMRAEVARLEAEARAEAQIEELEKRKTSVAKKLEKPEKSEIDLEIEQKEAEIQKLKDEKRKIQEILHMFFSRCLPLTDMNQLVSLSSTGLSQ
jgi:predicted RNase H-like nuclease (RuvC/YqgF family)